LGYGIEDFFSNLFYESYKSLGYDKYFNITDTIYIIESENQKNNENKNFAHEIISNSIEKNKIKILFDLINEFKIKKEKILIYSEYIEPLTYVKRELIINNIKYFYIDGSIQNKDEIINKFNEINKFAILLCSEVITNGFDIDCTNVIILSHSYSVDNLIQLKGRPTRLSFIKDNITRNINYITLIIKSNKIEDDFEVNSDTSDISDVSDIDDNEDNEDNKNFNRKKEKKYNKNIEHRACYCFFIKFKILYDLLEKKIHTEINEKKEKIFYNKMNELHNNKKTRIKDVTFSKITFKEILDLIEDLSNTSKF
jgi:superfamily II DNA or RNA helicase